MRQKNFRIAIAVLAQQSFGHQAQRFGVIGMAGQPGAQGFFGFAGQAARQRLRRRFQRGIPDGGNQMSGKGRFRRGDLPFAKQLLAQQPPGVRQAGIEAGGVAQGGNSLIRFAQRGQSGAQFVMGVGGLGISLGQGRQYPQGARRIILAAARGGQDQQRRRIVGFGFQTARAHALPPGLHRWPAGLRPAQAVTGCPQQAFGLLFISGAGE